MESRLTGPGSTCEADGRCTSLDGDQHLDLDTTQEHAAPHATSRPRLQGRAAGPARSVWRGVIRVAQGRAEDRRVPGEPQPAAVAARRTPTRSRASRSRPTTCAARTARRSAGSTAELLFYLMSRGLDRAGRRAADRRGLLRRRLRSHPLARAARAGPAGAAREAAVSSAEVHTPLDVARIRADFPILSREIDGKPIAYLDSANSAQKPRADDRRDVELLRDVVRQRAPRRLHARRGGDRGVRGHAQEGADAAQRAVRARGDLHARRDRGDQPRGVLVRPHQRRPRRRDRHAPRSSTTRTSCRGRCWRRPPAPSSGTCTSTSTAS